MCYIVWGYKPSRTGWQPPAAHSSPLAAGPSPLPWQHKTSDMLFPGVPEEENILHNIVNTSVPVSSFSVAQSNSATWGTLYSGAHLIGPERDSSGAYLHNHFRSQTSQHHLVHVCMNVYERVVMCVCSYTSVDDWTYRFILFVRLQVHSHNVKLVWELCVTCGRQYYHQH